MQTTTIVVVGGQACSPKGMPWRAIIRPPLPPWSLSLRRASTLCWS